jgi:demethylmenaquinone methyltransferase / 2-methoxy-6-polyprenyl-1,4-benzoquinol methylase
MAQTKVLCDPLKKKALNKKIFSIIAKEYMLITQLLSFFRDKAWKKRMVSVLPIFKKDDVVVDIASGTGDIARLIVLANPEIRLVGCDLTLSMLTIAKNASLSKNIFYSCQDMNALGLKPGSAACITGGYALRNAPELTIALAQFYSVLKQDGVAAFLDFSKSPFPPLAHLQIAALRLWGGLWGLILHGKPWVYGYIGDSLKQFPDRNSLHTIFKDAGFFVVASQIFMFGFIELTIVKKVSRKSV